MLLPNSLLIERFKTPDQIYQLKISIKTNQSHTFFLNNSICNSLLKWKQDMSTSLRHSNWFKTRMSQGITCKMLSQLVTFTFKVQPRKTPSTNELWSLNLHWKSAERQTFWNIRLSSFKQEIQTLSDTQSTS